MNRTNISWTEWTSNPLYAVRKSDGRRGWHCEKYGLDCENCYAETLDKRYGMQYDYSPEFTSKVQWRLNRKELKQILRIKDPRMIFLGDMLDIHADFVPMQLIRKIYATMIRADQHIFQILSKRSRNMMRFVNEMGGVPDHIWLGTSIGHWMYKPRLEPLRETNARIRFVSFEPLIDTLRPPIDLHGISWVIVGGESGPNYRPMNKHWALEVLTECKRQHVPLWFKQDSDRYPGRRPILLGQGYHEYPSIVKEWWTRREALT